MKEPWMPTTSLIVPIPDVRQIVMDPVREQEVLPPPGDYWARDFLQEPALWLHVDMADYPTVPAFIESLRALGRLELELTEANLQYLAQTEVPRLILMHERALPLEPYRLAPPAEGCGPDDIVPGTGKAMGSYCNHELVYAAREDEYPCTWALWPLSGLIHEEGHRTQRILRPRRDGGGDVPCVHIGTADVLYRVTLPEEPKAMTYTPAAFAEVRLPL